MMPNEIVRFGYRNSDVGVEESLIVFPISFI